MADDPRRAVVVTIRLGADSMADALSALKQIHLDAILHGDRIGQCVSGGYSAGWIVEVDEDPSWTHDRYISAINEVIDRDCAARDAAEHVPAPTPDDLKGVDADAISAAAAQTPP